MACDPAELPACPCRNHRPAHRQQMAAAHHARSTGRHEALRRAEALLGSISQKVLTSNLREMEERLVDAGRSTRKCRPA